MDEPWNGSEERRKAMARIRQINPRVKYYPPRLMERLEYIKTYSLTLAEAPSGFGKTTILGHFLETCLPQGAVWGRCEFVPNQKKAGWKQVCALFALADRECSERMMSIGSPDEASLHDLAGALRDLKCETDVYLWLDDFVNWGIETPGKFLEILSRHGGERLHIIVSTQPLGREKWGVFFRSGEIWRLREDSFIFGAEDIDSYFRTAGISLTMGQVEEVSRLSEGWIMALSLQMANYAANGDFHQGGMEELLETVFWGRLSPAEQKFLLEVSVFPRFTLGEAVGFSGLGQEQTVKLLTDSRFFVHYDPGSRCFYLHTQLHRMLEERFYRLSETRRKEICLRAGELAEQEKDRLQTLRFYYASGEWERLYAMSLTSYEIADITDESTRPMILDLLENAPAEMKRKYPKALIPLAFALFFLGENDKLLAVQTEISACIRESTLPQKEKDALQGEMELLLSFLEYNRIDAMSRRHRRALELLGGPARLISVKSTWTFGSPSVLYMFWRESGHLEEELEQMDRCMPYYYRLTEGHGSGAEFIMRAEALFQRGETDEAEQLCHRALLTADLKRQNSICQCSLFLLCCIAIQRGEKTLLEESRQALRRRAGWNTEDLCRHTLDLAEGFLSLLLDRPEEIPAWLAEGQIDQRRLVIMTQPFAYLIYGRVLLLRKKYRKLLGVSEYFLGLSSFFPNLLPQVYAFLYMGQALGALGRHTEAAGRIRSALELAAPDRIYMPFVENYSGIRAYLPLTEEMESHRAAISQMYHIRENARGRAFSAFTPREKDVLRYLRQDLTNNKIAEKLFLSPNTVRNIISGMLKKRKLASREQLKELPEE